jgi:fructose-1,6-bisphosphatase/inositol monophosphatase family enzyme
MTFDDTAIDWLAELLADAARAEIMPRFRRLGEGDIRQKTSAADLVTEADVNAERLITARLRQRYPSAMVVGEEACSDNPALLDGLGDADLAFVIDPVDGTFNFASGVPLFGVMLGVVVKGETVAGIIHDPVGKDWLIGAKGAGSHIRHAHGALEKVHVAEAVPVSQMTGSVSWQYLAEPQRSLLARNQTKTLSQFGYRCAAHEYRLLAYLMHHTGRVVSRTELVEHLYDQDFDRDSNTIEVFVGRIRKKLDVDIIQTVRGLGYLLTPPSPGA